MLGAISGILAANRSRAPSIELVSVSPTLFPTTSAGAYFNGGFSSLGFIVSSPYPVFSFRSEDIGQSWAYTNQALNREARTLIQGPDRLVVLSGNSATGRHTSVTLDGINWTHYTNNLPVAGYWYDGVYDGSFYVAANYSSATMAQSTDGVTWTARATTGITTTGIEAMAYGNGFYLAGHRNNNNVYRSDNGGFTWYVASTRPYSFTGLDFVNGFFFANSQILTGTLAFSADGINWTSVTIPGVTGIVPSPVWVSSAGRWFTRANAGGLTSWAMWSDDLVTWHQIPVPSQINGFIGGPLTDGTTVVGLATPNSSNSYGYRVVNL